VRPMRLEIFARRFLISGSSRREMGFVTMRVSISLKYVRVKKKNAIFY
jgi:hypothetical protein